MDFFGCVYSSATSKVGRKHVRTNTRLGSPAARGVYLRKIHRLHMAGKMNCDHLDEFDADATRGSVLGDEL